MSIKQFLVIHKFPTLFTILDEIKSNLNFNIEHLTDNKLPKNSEDNNFLIISSDRNYFPARQLKIDKYPISIEKLIELINIQFLKNNFNRQNNIKISNYLLNLNSRSLSLQNKSIKLTEKEIKIISFLDISKGPVTVKKLQSEVWGHKSKLETHTVETHVYRLRKKIEKKFHDRLFIISIKDGYKIKV
ncbi:winged helix-turn-helix domain-containing protein [Candidatus Pelagibacter sp.]|nr:winged helix-turn-helix domain-containing protein [Candidatus Pelagibacter sp.]